METDLDNRRSAPVSPPGSLWSSDRRDSDVPRLAVWILYAVAAVAGLSVLAGLSMNLSSRTPPSGTALLSSGAAGVICVMAAGGLQRRERRGRILGFIAGIVMLPSFPLGTIAGAAVIISVAYGSKPKV